MEHHTLSLWEIILESNVINFAVFIGVIIWFANKSLPAMIQQKNIQLQDELNKAKERCQSAEKSLALAEKELASFKENLDKMQAETERRIISLKKELNEERVDKLTSVKQKYEREIGLMKLNLKSEIEAKMVAKSLEIAESLLANKLNSSKADQIIIDNTLKLIETNPNILRN